MYNDNFDRFNSELEINVQVLSAILDRAIHNFDRLGHTNEMEVQQHINLKCCKLILQYDPDMTFFKRRIGLSGYNQLTECLLSLKWSDNDVFLLAYIDVLNEVAIADENSLAA